MLTQDGYGTCVVDCSQVEGGLYVNDETNMACVCKEGYHMDATTGMCFSCEDKIEGCDTCILSPQRECASLAKTKLRDAIPVLLQLVE